MSLVSSGGYEDVFFGCVTSSATIMSGGWIWLAGGNAYEPIVSNGGALYVRSHGGELSYASGAQILSGGFMDVYDSSTAKGTVIHEGGYVRIRDYGVASSTLIEHGASMYVHAVSGLAMDTVVSGFARVYDSALMSNTTIASGASFHVWKSGVLKDVVVQYGGLLDMREEAPVISGDIQVAGQLRAYAKNENVDASGANIVVDLSSRSSNDNYSIVNWDWLGANTFSVNVAADQASGVYKLASNAASFDQTVNLTVEGDEASFSLSIGHVVENATATYTLAKGEDNALTLAIGKASQIDDTNYPVMSAYNETNGLVFGMGNISEFRLDDDDLSTVFVTGIAGLTKEDWSFKEDDPASPYEFTHVKINDAEKTDRNHVDDLWCGQLTGINLWNWIGSLNSAGYQDEDDFLNECVNNGNQDYSLSVINSANIIWGEQWGTSEWDLTPERFDVFSSFQQAEQNMRNGAMGTWEVHHGTVEEWEPSKGGHAMLLMGFVHDEHYSKNDPRYYSGLVIADSDNFDTRFDHAEDAPDNIRIIRISWDATRQTYWLSNGASHFNCLGTQYHNPITGSADLTWYHPNDWSAPMTISVSSGISQNNPWYRSNDILYVNFAITNQGMSESGIFYVSLYVDNQLEETFKVNSLQYGNMATFVDYSIGQLSIGTHIISAVIDSHDNVAESTKKNNIFSKTITVHEAEGYGTVSESEGFSTDNDTYISSIKILGNARVHIRGSNAEARDMIVSSGGILYVSSGAKLMDSLIDTSGTLYVYSNGITSHTTIIGNQVTISGGTCVEDVLSSGGIQDVFLDGMVSRTVVSSGGKILLAGGQALDAIVSNGGALYVRSHGGELSYASGAQILSGGFMDVYDSSTAEGTVIHEGGYVRVRDYGVASSTLIEHGASMYVHAVSGFARDTVVSGFARVYDSALMSNTTIASGASFHVWKSGVLKDVVVQYGGLLDMREEAPVISGDILVAGQLRAFSANENVDASNANIVIDLSSRSSKDDYSIVNWDWLGANTFSVKVSSEQTGGVYKLASKATSFNQTIAVNCTDGSSATLSLGTEARCGACSYKLNMSGTNLNLTVTALDMQAPVLASIGANTTAITNNSVTVTARFTDNVAVTSCQYRLEEQDNWTSYTQNSGIIIAQNTTVYFKAFDAAGNVSDIASYKVENIDKTKPTITDIVQDIATPTNGNVLVTASFADNMALRTTQYRIGTGSWQAYSSGVQMSTNGTIEFRAFDSAGNSATVKHTVSNIDKVAPSIKNIAQDITSTTNADVLVTAAFADNVALKVSQYRFGNGEWQAYTSGALVSTNGVIEFRAIDSAGNSTTACHTISNIDKVAPIITDIAKDIATPTNGNVKVTAEAYDEANTVTLYYSKDGGDFSEYTEAVEFTANGNVVFKAVDAAGNVTISENIVVDNIDTIAPSVTSLTIDAPAQDATSLVTIIPSEPLSLLQYSWNDSEWQVLTEMQLSVAQNGAIRFRLGDLAGNISTSAPYDIAPFNAYMSCIECRTSDEGCTILDWSLDATSGWSHSYDVILAKDNGTIEMEELHASGLEILNATSDAFAISAKPDKSEVWTELGQSICPLPSSCDNACIYSGVDNGLPELMFADGTITWGEDYLARHVGVGAWQGTREKIVLSGKNVLNDVFFGSNDASMLLLTDKANGDSIFVDDIYSAFPEELDAQARIAKIDEIRAGAGDDIVDLTSQRFEYIGDGLTVRGGNGDDVIWSNKGDNMLFGDKGNDRIVGAFGNDLLVGGAGNDTLHGGGGNDIFAFGSLWGDDTVEQLAGGSSILWFVGVERANVTLTADAEDNAVLSCNAGTVKLINIKYDDILPAFTSGNEQLQEGLWLRFGDDGSEQYNDLLASGAFDAFTSENVFKDRGMLA